MKRRDWHAPADQLPEEGQVVVAMDSAGTVKEMKFYRGLWFLAPDFTVYAYYTPAFWQEKERTA